MIQFYNWKGVKATVQKINFRLFSVAAAAFFAALLTACSGTTGPATTGSVDPNEVAARVNGKDIKMEEVEKALKVQSGGEEANYSPLELASARLSVLQQIIQAEVMYQKAEKEQALPTDEEVTAEMNKRRTGSGLSAEEFEKQMKQAGETEDSWRLNVKKELALGKLQEKIAGRVEAPKDSEITEFYNTNKDQFKNKRGADLAAIVIDPTDSGQGDSTRNQDEAMAKAREVGQRAMTGSDFATLARETSEDLQTRSRGGDWRYFTEDEMKQTLGASVADYIMNKMQNGQIIPQAIPFEGRILIIKLQRKQEKDEDLTLESPGVRQRVTELLINARKSLLWQSYGVMALNEAKIENYLVKKIVDNPNELSGARPARAATPEPAANSNTAANGNTASNANTASNTAAANTGAANAAANKPAANTASNGNANTASNAK